MTQPAKNVGLKRERRVEDGQTVHSGAIFQRERGHGTDSAESDKVHFGHRRKGLRLDVHTALVDGQLTDVLEVSGCLCV